jgi:polyprenyldihydroxybenzoate methyltransferase/3-demethylubiquinol 3-O-methyltransferase
MLLQRGVFSSIGRVSWRRMARYATTSSASQEELTHFAELADSWWDADGPQRILHKMNLMRMDYIRDTLGMYSPGNLPGYSVDLLPHEAKSKIVESRRSSIGSGYEVLDVGCGGGLLAESMARLKEVKHVQGIDLTSDVIKVAERHKQQDPVLDGKLDYRLIGIEDVTGQYDIVTMFEILEHVPRPAEVLKMALDRVREGGWLFVSTINRTPVSYFTTIFMGEDVLGIVPKGTHTYSKYINEHEVRDWLKTQHDWEFVRSDGCMFVPFLGWKLNNFKATGNYLFAARRKQQTKNEHNDYS